MGIGTHASTKLVPALRQNNQNIVGIVSSKDVFDFNFTGPVFRTMEEALAQTPIDTVFLVSSPPKLHFSQTASALKSGRNVILEKPGFIFRKDAEEASFLATQKQLVIAEAWMYKFSKVYSKLISEWVSSREQITSLDMVFTLPNLPPGTYRNSPTFGNSIIFDIGAFRGEWSTLLNKTSLKNKNFYLFEANEENREFLERSGFKFFFNVLSDRRKEVKFFSKASTGDSYLVEQTSFYTQDIKPILKNTVSLDEVVLKENLPYPDLMKIDTQGSELDILKGGKKTLSRCKLIYMECPIIEYNAGSPKLDDYISFLDSIDFVPYDICEVHHIDNILVQADIIFIRKPIFRKIFPQETILNIIN